MVPGQDDDGLAEPAELGLHERHRLVGHAIVIEEIAGDQEEIDAIRQDPIDDAPERVPVALVVRRPLLGIAVSVAAEMHVGGVKHAQGRRVGGMASSMPHGAGPATNGPRAAAGDAAEPEDGAPVPE